MAYWIGDQHPRLHAYVEGLKVQVPHVPVEVYTKLIEDFQSTVLPNLAALSSMDTATLSKKWMEGIVLPVEALPLHIFEPDRFQCALDEAVRQGASTLDASCTNSPEFHTATELLKKRALATRNRHIDMSLKSLINRAEFLGFGDAVLAAFFELVESNAHEVLGSQNFAEENAIRFVWEQQKVLQEVTRNPRMTAPVALLFILTCAAHKSSTTPSRRLDRAYLHSSNCASTGFDRVSVIEKRKFCSQVLPPIIEALDDRFLELLNRSDSALRNAALHPVRLLKAAKMSEDQFIDSDVDVLFKYFDNESMENIQGVLHALLTKYKGALASALGIGNIQQFTKNDYINTAQILVRLKWNTEKKTVLRNWILKDSNLQALCAYMHENSNAQKAAKSGLGVHSLSCKKSLAEVVDRRRMRRESLAQMKSKVLSTLTSSAFVDSTLSLAERLGVDLAPLRAAQEAAQRETEVLLPPVAKDVYQAVLQRCMTIHSNWVEAKVLPSTHELVIPDTIESLRIAVRIYLRLNVVPAAARAWIASTVRRRIGPIGYECHEYNVAAEVGIVEHYDTTDHKKYDWQGWYQRMVDIHNRNVSIKCSVEDLKFIGPDGRPFLDTQSERRLRAIAKDRVGVGVLKLDSDRFEDQSDNLSFGSTKLFELLAESRKAQLGKEYWPTVEVKVRRPSGQTKMRYSLMDYDRIEAKSAELYTKYRDAKKRSLFVTPMDLWIKVQGASARKAADSADAEGYTIDSLHDSLKEE
jgi:hypothetical protein